MPSRSFERGREHAMRPQLSHPRVLLTPIRVLSQFRSLLIRSFLIARKSWARRIGHPQLEERASSPKGRNHEGTFWQDKETSSQSEETHLPANWVLRVASKVTLHFRLSFCLLKNCLLRLTPSSTQMTFLTSQYLIPASNSISGNRVK